MNDEGFDDAIVLSPDHSPQEGGLETLLRARTFREEPPCPGALMGTLHPPDHPSGLCPGPGAGGLGDHRVSRLVHGARGSPGAGARSVAPPGWVPGASHLSLCLFPPFGGMWSTLMAHELQPGGHMLAAWARSFHAMNGMQMLKHESAPTA